MLNQVFRLPSPRILAAVLTMALAASSCGGGTEDLSGRQKNTAGPGECETDNTIPDVVEPDGVTVAVTVPATTVPPSTVPPFASPDVPESMAAFSSRSAEPATTGGDARAGVEITSASVLAVGFSGSEGATSEAADNADGDGRVAAAAAAAEDGVGAGAVLAADDGDDDTIASAADADSTACPPLL